MLHTLDFSGIEQLNGGSGADTFYFQDSAVFSGDLDGGAGTDTLDYSAYADAVVIDVADDTTSSISGVYENIEAIVGSSQTDEVNGLDGDDTFSVTAYKAVSVNGGLILSAIDVVNGLLGSDTLDFSAFADALDLTLTDETTDGFGGNETSSGIAFSGIEILTGNANTDSIKGLDADATWQMSGSAAGTYSIGAGSLAFSSFEILTGSAYQDILDTRST